MKKNPKFIWMLIALAAPLAGIKYAIANNGDVLRYKVTVTVTTPEGEKTGSAVREAGRYSEMRILPQQGGVTYNIAKGEAVVIDLGKSGVLFALMGDREEAEVIFNMFPNKKAKDRVTMTLEQMRRYPQFVHFKNLNDQKAVEYAAQRKIEGGHYDGPYIDGGSVAGINFNENIFGKGINLKEVTIELTGDPVTTGIEKYLPWLSHVYGYISSKGGCGGPPITCLDSGDFERK